MRTSLRYDLPGQDEAFAAATTPPVPGQALPPVTIATSLDWAGLIAHWKDLGRRSAIAAVVDSVADGMTSDVLLDKGAKAPAAVVTTLIGQATWSTRLGFARADGTEALPYGTGLIGDKPYVGDAALRGLTETITVKRSDGRTADYEMIGFSPVMTADGDWLVDMQRLGRQALRSSGALQWRPIRSAQAAETQIAGLATLDKPIAVAWQGAAAHFCFWLKDLAITKDGTGMVPGKAADFDAWQPARLALGASEWRLHPSAPADQRERFQAGEDRIALFGIELEPLQLMRVTACMVDGVPQDLSEIVIRCRVHAGQASRAAEHEDNSFRWC